MDKMAQQEEVTTIQAATAEILDYLGYRGMVEVSDDYTDPATRVVAINSVVEPGRLIGKNGQNIPALECLVRLLIAKRLPAAPNITLDINDYRKSRAQVVVKQALAIVERVRASKKAEALLPMSSYERRLVHLELASLPDVETESVGQEPQRRVVVRPLII